MRLLVLAAAALVAGACSSPVSHESVRTRAQPIQYGELDEKSRFAVGICRTKSAPGRCIGICSGALILPNVVATARHCVEESALRVDCREAPRFAHRKDGELFVTTRLRMSEGGSWHAVSAVHTPKDDHVCGNDMALLELEEAIPQKEAKPVTPGVRYMMWDRPRYEATFTAIGYGTTSPDGDGSGVRRKLDLVSVLCIPGSPNLPCPDGFNANEFAGGDGTCSGDSGSSAFERSSFERGDAVSFGVLSRGSVSEDETACVSSVYTRFDAHRDFVVEVAERASAGFTLYPKPAWTAPRAVDVTPDAGAPPQEPSPVSDVVSDSPEPAGRENRGCSTAVATGEEPLVNALFFGVLALLQRLARPRHPLRMGRRPIAVCSEEAR
jgi:hypothetical protein